jgi:hypothetical protein
MAPVRGRPMRLALLSASLLAAVLALAVAGGVAWADGPDEEVRPDPSGLETGSGKNLIGLSPGQISAEDYQWALQAEPFAAKLADLVDQNRLGVNFVWALVTGYLVMFM